MDQVQAEEFIRTFDCKKYSYDPSVRQIISQLKARVTEIQTAEKGKVEDDAKDNIKLIVVGDGAVGKTCLLVSFKTGEFPEKYTPTVFENSTSNAPWKERNVALHLWDTAGQEEYDRLRPLSYNGVDIVLLCFSVVSRASLDSITTKWVPEIRHYLPTCKTMLVGLKTDQRVEGTPDVNSGKVEPVTPEDGAALAKAINAVSYREASAKTRDGVHAVFDVAIDAIMSERFPAPPPEAAKQKKTAEAANPAEKPEKKKGGCVLL